MKTLLLLLLFAFSLSLQAQIKKVKQVTKVVPKKTTTTVTPPSQTVDVKTTTTATNTVIDTVPAASPVVFKAYQNYDFVPGDTVIFEDHFVDDQQGEFPSHWNLGAGQAVMNSVAGQKALMLTEGNYAHVSPLIKSPVYFGDAFTIEFDWYFNSSYGPNFYFYDNSADAKRASNDRGHLSLDHGTVEAVTADVDLTASFPDEANTEHHNNEWHHIAIAYKKNQLKVYMDQSRVLVVPNLGITPHAFDIEGIGNNENPIVLTNFRIARGAGMNMLGKKFTDAKIITHGINFDVNKAAIRPESMGTLNSVAQVMKDNPDLKFEVGGHTDSDGDDAFNIALSQARANAVRSQLISMGIDGSRLTAKGYGETKPISDNKTWEGKANNRRVEFVKK